MAYEPLAEALQGSGVSASAFNAKRITPKFNPKQFMQPQQQQVQNQSVAKPGNGSDYTSKLINIESGGNHLAANKSGATGLGQFMQGTAEPYLAKMGKTWGDYKGDANLQREVLNQHTAYNTKALRNRGIEANNENLWLAHNLGLGSAFSYHNGGTVNQKYIDANLPGGGGIEDYRRYWRGRFA